MSDDIPGLKFFELSFLKDELSTSVLTLRDQDGKEFRANLPQQHMIQFIGGLISSAGKATANAIASGKAFVPIPLVIPTNKIGIGTAQGQAILWVQCGALQLSFSIQKEQLLAALSEANKLPNTSKPSVN